MMVYHIQEDFAMKYLPSILSALMPHGPPKKKGRGSMTPCLHIMGNNTHMVILVDPKFMCPDRFSFRYYWRFGPFSKKKKK